MVCLKSFLLTSNLQIENTLTKLDDSVDKKMTSSVKELGILIDAEKTVSSTDSASEDG